LLLAVVLPCTGCGPLGRIIHPGSMPARELWRLTPTDSVYQRLTGGRPFLAPVDSAQVHATSTGGDVRQPVLPGTLAVTSYTTPGVYGDRGIVWRRGEAEYGEYDSREWAIPLGDMLAHLTAELAARGELSAEPPSFDPMTAGSQTWQWRATVRRFEEVDRGKEVSVSVHIEARIVRAADDSLVWSGAAAVDRPVVGSSILMRNVVAAMSDAAAEVIARLLADAERDLRRAPPAAAAPARARP
jgi:uncharacterized lipoprotein YmbA